jgi:shikimate kinase
MAPKLILTGFMASGKSVVALSLSRRLGWRLIDCDAEIIARAGKPIDQIFRDNGEAHFRALERALIAEIASDRSHCAQCRRPRPAVIATGGGTIVDADNYALLRRCGLIICLHARPEVIAERIGHTAQTRPMLAQSRLPLKQRLAELIEARREAYARAAITIDTSDLNVEQVTDTIFTVISEYHREQWRALA